MRGDALLRTLRKIIPASSISQLGERKGGSELLKIGLYSSDDVMQPPARRGSSAYVVNTDFAQGPGEHYVAFYVVSGRIVYYYDSYGVPPYDALLEWWRAWNVSILAYSPYVLQSPLSDACGYHVAAFLKCMSLGVDFDDFLNSFPVHLPTRGPQLFTAGALDENDRLAKDFVTSF